MKKIDVYSFTPIDVQDPEPQDNEVLIKVRATVVNTSDVLARDYTRYPQSSKSYMGLECSGTIEKVGQKVKKWNEGDEVCAIVSAGGYAEKVVVHESEKPLNRFYYLRDETVKTRLYSGKTLLVHEDCNGTSSFAIQIAKNMNVDNVYATYRSDSFRQHCEIIGVTQFMPQDDFLNGAFTQGFDVILNNLGPDDFKANFLHLNVEGMLINTSTCGSDTLDSFSSIPSRPNKKLPKRVIIEAASLLHRDIKERSKIVSEVEEDMWPTVDSIKPFVHQEVFPFSKVGDAYRLVEAGGSGKVVLVPDDIFNAPIEEDGI